MEVEARKKWLKWRRGGLGGSDVAGVLNLSPWSSPFSVWWSKVRDLEEEDRPILKRGRLLEDAILQWAGNELGGLVRGSPVVHPERRPGSSIPNTGGDRTDPTRSRFTIGSSVSGT
jgi:predicted phage-related endonuclease